MASRRERNPREGVKVSLSYGKKSEKRRESVMGEERSHEEEIDNAGLSDSYHEMLDSDDSVNDPNYEIPVQHRDSSSEEESTGRDSVGVVGEASIGVVGEGDGSMVAGPSGVVAQGEGGGGGGGGRVSRSRVRGRGKEQAGSRAKRGRKTARKFSADEEVKKKRNLGLEYVSYRSGKTVEARRVGSPCKDGCFDRVSEEARESIFKNFWDIGNYNEQNSYISQCVKAVPVKRRYGQGKHSVERKNYEYTVKYFNETFQICRVAFMHIHGISNSRLQFQMRRMRLSETDTSPGDKRGRHGTVPKMKISGPRLERVHEHIMSLRTTSSHTRAKSPHRQYLEDCASVKDMYEKYRYWMSENEYEEEPVKLEFYWKIFSTKYYNVSFKPPKNDLNEYSEPRRRM